MYEIYELTAVPIEASKLEKTPQIRLNLPDHETPALVLDGAILNNQYQMDDGRFLIFLTDDVPYEETLRIILLDQNLEAMDGLIFGGGYATGTLKNIKIIDKKTIQFSFVHEKQVRIQVTKEPRWRGFGLGTPGVSRIGRWMDKRYLSFSFVE